MEFGRKKKFCEIDLFDFTRYFLAWTFLNILAHCDYISCLFTYFISTFVCLLFRQYEEDKQSALQQQRQQYEKHFQQLKSYMSPSTPYPPFVPYDPFTRIGSKMTPTTPSVMSRLEKWGQQR